MRVINLASRGTIEAYVLEILDRKIKMFELVVGEMEEILGAWQPNGSFEDEIFRRWTESANLRTRNRRFAELAPAPDGGAPALPGAEGPPDHAVPDARAGGDMSVQAQSAGRRGPS